MKFNVIGLGDVGGTVVTGLKLLGGYGPDNAKLTKIGIFDPNEPLCKRYETELNQVISPEPGVRLPEVKILSQDELYDCDCLLFTASIGVPGLDSKVTDVRMAQFEGNRKLVASYVRGACEAGFKGIYCQIGDPVDHLCGEANRVSRELEAEGKNALRSDQIRGFGLGVMYARAAYYAQSLGIDFTNGRVYGPHGQGLVVANDFGAGYDDELSRKLTELTVTANIKVRDLGFKPYIAPGLSSAAISVLRMMRGETYFGALYNEGAYCGGLAEDGELIKEELHPQLEERVCRAYEELRNFDYSVRN